MGGLYLTMFGLLVWIGLGCAIVFYFYMLGEAYPVFKIISYPLLFIITCCVMTGWLALRGLWWLATDGRRRAAPRLRRALLFAWFLIDELVPDEPETEAPEEPQPKPQSAVPPDPLREAFKLFGLKVDCTKEDVLRAHRAAIRKAHPDRGGSAVRAAEINAARDLIMERKGWAAARRAA